MLRIILFLGTNLAIMLVLSAVVTIFGLDRWAYSHTGMNLQGMLVLCAVFGMGGAFISLAMSKMLAKMSVGAQVIEQPRSADERWLFDTVRTLSRFIPALVIFNLVLVFTHWPLIVNAALENGLVHFLIHALLLVSSLIVWMPIVSPLPEIPRLVPVLQMLYLFAWSVVPTVPASFLTFGASPLYKFYEHVPHLFGFSTLEDQQAAGLIMKIGAGLLLWMIIAVVFFRWASEEERANTPRHGLDEMDRELTEMGLRR